jgi:hypothetical protein
MRKYALLCALVMALGLILSGCGCDHEWYAATCKAPKTCSLCGETQGEALPHTWQDATCTTAKICTVCDTTEGEALGHSWQDATCTDPKTCTRCHVTEGEAAGHQWEDATTEIPQTCTVCKRTTGGKLNVDPRFTTESTKALYGTWVCDIMASDEILGLENFGGLECRMVMEFGKTGVMTLHMELKDKNAFQDKFRAYIMNALYEGFAAEGLSKEEADQAMLDSTGMTVLQYVDTILEQVNFSEWLDLFHAQEVYYVQDGQLFSALNWDAVFEGKAFTLTDGKLVVDGVAMEEGGEPLVWTRP